MDWNQILTSVILGIVGIVISILGALASRFISTKIKDDKIKTILNGALDVVNDGVNYVYQTYVQGLKGTSLWDENAMNEASQKALDYIKNNLSADLVSYLNKNGKDLTEWIKEQIEVAIAKDKKTTSNNTPANK